MSDVLHPRSDFYLLESTLTEAQQEKLRRVRRFMVERIRPAINDYWIREEFPHNLIPEMAELEIAGNPYQGYGCPGESWLFEGFLTQELARVDCSIATFFGVHSGLAMGTLYLCGSDEQKQRWLPRMRTMELI